MSTRSDTDWLAQNQRHVMAALGRVRLALKQHAGHPKKSGPRGHTPRAASGPDGGPELVPPARLDVVCGAFGLSPFERDVMLMCAGPELDGQFATVLCSAHADPRRVSPTFGLALAALPDAHWSALAPGAPLRRWQLIELGKSDTLINAPLTLDERILHYLTGVSDLDEHLQGIVQCPPSPGELPPSQLAVSRRIVDLWSSGPAADPRPLLLLCGTEAADRLAVSSVASASLGLGLLTLRATDVPPAPSDRERLARLLEREAVLDGSAILVEFEDMGDTEPARGLIPFLRGIHCLVIVSGPEPVRSGCLPLIRLDMARPTSAEQKTIWRTTLGQLGHALNGELDEVVAQFDFGVHTIRSTAAAIACQPAEDGRGDLQTQLWDTCRVQARPSLDDLAQRIESHASWDDLVLPDDQRRLLREMLAQVRHRARVYEAWGFAAKGGTRGLGISGLFAGPSGTGKTLAAEVIAHELRLDLYRIDLSQVVSKYIGETEKNLRRVFDAAEGGGTILLFDEADALFGKRSEVKDSHDRYANVEVSYLLQRMESYRGLAILTTNMRQALDSAFLRRIKFVVQFPFPDAAARAEIWRRIFPAATPREGLQAEKLARLNVPGGNIRNIAMQAAFIAADVNEPVRMAHILQAARTEYAKIERTLTEAEIGGWI